MTDSWEAGTAGLIKILAVLLRWWPSVKFTDSYLAASLGQAIYAVAERSSSDS